MSSLTHNVCTLQQPLVGVGHVLVRMDVTDSTGSTSTGSTGTIVCYELQLTVADAGLSFLFPLLVLPVVL